MAAQLVFYTNPQSRGRIARWMLEEVGTPYETKALEYGGSMKSADYLAVNPMGKVPAIRHGDRIVTETAAICAYLADAFPEAGLAPPPDERAAYYRWLFFGAGPLEAALTNAVLNVAVDDTQRMMVGYGSLDDVLNALEAAVDGRAFIAGERFSAADVYVGSHIGWGLQFKTLERRPAFVEYWSRLESRPANRRANAIDHALAEAGDGDGSGDGKSPTGAARQEASD